MPQPKKLIEVAMPVKEISAESVRDKSIRHGHISTLHLWWARRPLPVCRAVVFASLVPDPLDPNCSQAFRDAVELLLGSSKKPLNEPGMLVNAYKPYSDIPWTSVIDPMEDNLRNRLMMFIGKFSDVYIENEKLGKKTPVKEQLSEYSLIKWDNKNSDNIINKARKLIWVAFNSEKGSNADNEEILSDFDKHYKAVTSAEYGLYSIHNRNIETSKVCEKEVTLRNAINSFYDRMPIVFDPFAGGGAIPLEAARLGCRSYGNDLNPVAHIIQKGSVEFPQKFGKPITLSKRMFIEQYGSNVFNSINSSWRVYEDGDVSHINIPNRLSFDVEFYSKRLLKLTENEIGNLYPSDEQGNKPIAYYWARIGKCSNPTCEAEVPLLRDFYLVNNKSKQVYLNPIISGKKIDFEINKGRHNFEGWMYRANLKCPCCGNVTDVKSLKKQFNNRITSEKILAVIEDGKNGKLYRKPKKSEIDIITKVNDREIPSESLPVNDSQNLKIPFWGFKSFGEMYTKRQLNSIYTLIENLQTIKGEIDSKNSEYSKAVVTYLAILIDRIALASTSFGRWHTGKESLEHPFSKQAIPMIFDFPESTIFNHSTGSGYNQIQWILKYIDSESGYPFYSNFINASSGEISQFEQKSLSATVTDPPYYDAIAYADLSDFFYVWLKRSLSDLYPINFAYPQTPKSEECTALKYQHNGSIEEAKEHFEDKLNHIFESIEKQTKGIVSIMFAHQSTEAWATLCNSVLSANMNITGSWAIDTEMANRSLGLSSGGVLASSVTISCRPSESTGLGDFREIKEEIEKLVKKEIKLLYSLGFRGADLLTACFGRAVSVFGRYEIVEKADGSNVTVAELLDLARDAAFNAIISDINTDDYTRFYIGWLNLFGFTQAEHDDVRRITQIGLSIDSGELLTHHILIREGNKESLAEYNFRINENEKLGSNVNDYEIDKCHQMMNLFKKGNRTAILKYIARMAPTNESSLWRILNSLYEVLPVGCDDHKQVAGILTNKESFIRDAKGMIQEEGTQAKLEL